MATIIINGKKYPVCDDGFLQDKTLWCDDWILHVRKELCIKTPLDEIKCSCKKVREYYENNGFSPMTRILVRVVQMSLNTIYDKFYAPQKGLVRMSGLPKACGS